MDIEGGQIGKRVRQVRNWRRMTVTATAGLAGMSVSQLSRLERGERAISKRATLEALARALRVSPTELTGKPYVPTDEVSNRAHAAVVAIEDVLAGWQIGDIPDTPSRPWPEVVADLDQLELLMSKANWADVATMVAALIRDLLVAVSEPEHRRAALVGLLNAYQSAAYVTKHLGFPGLPMLGVERMRQVAEALDDPVWSAQVVWEHAVILNGTNRARQYEISVAAADMTTARPETRGMANLTAALAAATQGNGDLAQTHLTEAAALAELLDEDVSPWAQTMFGRTNVGIWAVTVGVELGYGAKVAELAAKVVRPESITTGRQAALWIDYGRGLLADKQTRERGLAALLRAEKLAPQRVRNDFFVREAVSDLLGMVQREAVGRELRGLAYRMGVNPIG